MVDMSTLAGGSRHQVRSDAHAVGSGLMSPPTGDRASAVDASSRSCLLARCLLRRPTFRRWLYSFVPMQIARGHFTNILNRPFKPESRRSVVKVESRNMADRRAEG